VIDWIIGGGGSHTDGVFGTDDDGVVVDVSVVDVFDFGFDGLLPFELYGGSIVVT